MNFIYYFLCLMLSSVFAIFIHEFSKALTSYLLGDKEIKNSKQLSLNPLKYIEPIGFIFMLVWQIGWAKPIETNNTYYKDRKKGTLITYTIPILINIIFCIIFYNLEFLWNGFYIMGYLNLRLAIFNLIPIHPLCGEKILKCFLKPNSVMKYMQIEPIIRILIILLIIMGPLEILINYFINFIEFFIRIFVFIK